MFCYSIHPSNHETVRWRVPVCRSVYNINHSTSSSSSLLTGFENHNSQSCQILLTERYNFISSPDLPVTAFVLSDLVWGFQAMEVSSLDETELQEPSSCNKYQRPAKGRPLSNVIQASRTENHHFLPKTLLVLQPPRNLGHLPVVGHNISWHLVHPQRPGTPTRFTLLLIL